MTILRLVKPFNLKKFWNDLSFCSTEFGWLKKLNEFNFNYKPKTVKGSNKFFWELTVKFGGEEYKKLILKIEIDSGSIFFSEIVIFDWFKIQESSSRVWFWSRVWLFKSSPIKKSKAHLIKVECFGHTKSYLHLKPP